MKKILVILLLLVSLPAHALIGAITPNSGESIEETWIEFLQDNGAFSPTILDAEAEFLNARGVALGNLTDRWMTYLGNLGYTGTLSERVAAWRAAGNPIGVVGDNFIFYDTNNFTFYDGNNFVFN